MRDAYVVLTADGKVLTTHSPDVAGSGSPNDLETLITKGYLAHREVLLKDGGILLVLRKGS